MRLSQRAKPCISPAFKKQRVEKTRREKIHKRWNAEWNRCNHKPQVLHPVHPEVL